MRILEMAVGLVALTVATACDAGPSARAESVNVPPASANRPALDTSLDRLIDTELVGGNLVYFEAISGPAKRVSEWGDRTHRDYDVAGCDVRVTAEGQTIRAITFTVTSQCNPEGFGMRFDGKTLEDAEAEIGGQYVGGCIRGCGNSVEPTYGLELLGYRANGNLNYRIEAQPTSDGEWDRVFAWGARMEDIHGEEHVLAMSFQCSDADKEGARAATKDLKITSVTVSNDFDMLTCTGSQ